MNDPILTALVRALVDSADDCGCDDDLTVASKKAIADLTSYSDRMSQEDYVKAEGFECPFCGSDCITFSGDVGLHNNTCSHGCSCRTCEKDWTEEYSLTGYEAE